MNLDPTTLIQIITSAIVALGIWYKDIIAQKIGIKKAKSDVASASLSNVQKNLDIYQSMIDDIDARYKLKLKEVEDSFSETITRLTHEVEGVKQINKELSEYIEEQKVIINKQSKRLDYFKKKYNEVD